MGVPLPRAIRAALAFILYVIDEEVKPYADALRFNLDAGID